MQLNSHKTKFERMNPFGKELERRLEKVDLQVFEELKTRLAEPACEYVFDCQYLQRKRARGGDNHRLVVMDYQNAYPPTKKKGKVHFEKQMGEMIGRYCGQAAKLMKNYPTDYTPLK